MVTVGVLPVLFVLFFAHVSFINLVIGEVGVSAEIFVPCVSASFKQTFRHYLFMYYLFYFFIFFAAHLLFGSV